jgi:hypothetical protein
VLLVPGFEGITVFGEVLPGAIAFEPLAHGVTIKTKKDAFTEVFHGR